jgi:hypothetical protein
MDFGFNLGGRTGSGGQFPEIPAGQGFDVPNAQSSSMLSPWVFEEFYSYGASMRINRTPDFTQKMLGDFCNALDANPVVVRVHAEVLLRIFWGMWAIASHCQGAEDEGMRRLVWLYWRIAFLAQNGNLFRNLNRDLEIFTNRWQPEIDRDHMPTSPFFIPLPDIRWSIMDMHRKCIAFTAIGGMSIDPLVHIITTLKKSKQMVMFAYSHMREEMHQKVSALLTLMCDAWFGGAMPEPAPDTQFGRTITIIRELQNLLTMPNYQILEGSGLPVTCQCIRASHDAERSQGDSCKRFGDAAVYVLATPEKKSDFHVVFDKYELGTFRASGFQNVWDTFRAIYAQTMHVRLGDIDETKFENALMSQFKGRRGAAIAALRSPKFDFNAGTHGWDLYLCAVSFFKQIGRGFFVFAPANNRFTLTLPGVEGDINIPSVFRVIHDRDDSFHVDQEEIVRLAGPWEMLKRQGRVWEEFPCFQESYITEEEVQRDLVPLARALAIMMHQYKVVALIANGFLVPLGGDLNRLYPDAILYPWQLPLEHYATVLCEQIKSCIVDISGFSIDANDAPLCSCIDFGPMEHPDELAGCFNQIKEGFRARLVENHHREFLMLDAWAEPFCNAIFDPENVWCMNDVHLFFTLIFRVFQDVQNCMPFVPQCCAVEEYGSVLFIQVETILKVLLSQDDIGDGAILESFFATFSQEKAFVVQLAIRCVFQAFFSAHDSGPKWADAIAMGIVPFEFSLKDLQNDCLAHMVQSTVSSPLTTNPWGISGEAA